MSDREFWLMVRRALLMFVAAIDKKYCLKSNEAVERLFIWPEGQ